MPIVNSELWWKRFRDDAIHAGFSDEQLAGLCDRNYCEIDLKYRSCKWLFWPTELYSFGRCYREWVGWPRLLPIPVIGDHGVMHVGKYQQHELDSPANVYLTWSKDRYNSLSKLKDKRVFNIPHPWIVYRHRSNIVQSPEAKGTLVFFPHSNEGIEVEDFDYDLYFSELMDLPEEFHPLVVCMHMHDIRKKYYDIVRKYGIPVVSAGNTLSPFFVDRFYSLLSQFKYATSNRGGSELFYCAEFGVKYFLYGEIPTYVNHSHRQMPKGILQPVDSVSRKLQDRKEALFRVWPSELNARQAEFVSDVLGLYCDKDIVGRKLRRVFLLEMIKILPVYLKFNALNYSKAIGRRVGFGKWVGLSRY